MVASGGRSNETTATILFPPRILSIEGGGAAYALATYVFGVGFRD